MIFFVIFPVFSLTRYDTCHVIACGDIYDSICMKTCKSSERIGSGVYFSVCDFSFHIFVLLKILVAQIILAMSTPNATIQPTYRKTTAVNARKGILEMALCVSVSHQLIYYTGTALHDVRICKL